MNQLYSYQTTAVDWMINREKSGNTTINDHDINVRGGILADEVGLGKTLMSISVVKQNPKKNTLILAPKSLLMQWKKEISLAAPDILVQLYDKTAENIENVDSEVVKIVLPSHSQLNAKNVDYSSSTLCGIYWDRIMIDEAHVIKNHKSKIHKACVSLSSSIKWALTATPVMNKMTDFINILGWVGIPQGICQAYKQLVSDTFILRRTKEDVSEDNEKLKLPDCHIDIHRLPFTSDEEFNLYVSVYNKMKDELEKLQKQGNKNTIRALELLLRVRQVCCHPQIYYDGIARKRRKNGQSGGRPYSGSCTKLNHIVNSITKIPVGDKALIFCHFIREMDAYCDVLEENGIQCARLDGSMDLIERSDNVHSFNSDDDCKVFVIQINTGGVGYNFQRANWLYITSPTWNPSLQHQVIGRAHRTGQSKEVHVNVYTIGDENNYYIEDHIMNLQRKKLKMIAEVLNDPRLSPTDANESDQAAPSLTFSDVSRMFKNVIHDKPTE